MGARLRCASDTIRTIWASSVSAPTRSRAHHEAARAVHGAARDPAVRRPSPPGWARPSPSIRRRRSGPRARRRRRARARRAARAGGRPARTSASGTSSSLPSSRRRRAVFGARPSSARMAPDVALRARSSSTWPRRTSVTITAAASKYTGGVAAVAHAVGQGAGSQHGEEAPAEGRRRAEGDQREHVQVARHEGLPAAHEEGPAAPEHHRRRQHELDPERRRRVDPPGQGGRDHLAHGEREDGNGQDQAHPEPPGHVDQLGARPLVGGERLERLERHAALGARAGSDLADLRVHGARVDPRVGLAAGGRRGGRRRQESRRIGDEPLAAARVAEPVRRRPRARRCRPPPPRASRPCRRRDRSRSRPRHSRFRRGRARPGRVCRRGSSMAPLPLR